MMNNTQRGECVRAIMSRKYDNTDEKLMEVYFNSYTREIERHIAGLEVNAKNTKALEAIAYLLRTLND